MYRALIYLSASLFVIFATQAMAQKSGQSMTIVHGVVVGSKNTQVKSNAGKGALVGGTIGYAASSGKSSSKKRKNALGGAALGALAASRAQGDRTAKEYTVETAGGYVVIISDQTQIVVGDCVIVENAGGSNANIRRVGWTYCEPEAQVVVASAEIQAEMMEEAEECMSAKRELAAAETDAVFDRAIRKVEILCDT